VDDPRRTRLEARLDELDAAFYGRLDFRCVGPLPPYSFATVETLVPTFGAVDGARKRLGLGRQATALEIKQAFRQRARVEHPDCNLNDPPRRAAWRS